jgi:hypothetical protein
MRIVIGTGKFPATPVAATNIVLLSRLWTELEARPMPEHLPVFVRGLPTPLFRKCENNRPLIAKMKPGNPKASRTLIETADRERS